MSEALSSVETAPVATAIEPPAPEAAEAVATAVPKPAAPRPISFGRPIPKAELEVP